MRFDPGETPRPPPEPGDLGFGRPKAVTAVGKAPVGVKNTGQDAAGPQVSALRAIRAV